MGVYRSLRCRGVYVGKEGSKGGVGYVRGGGFSIFWRGV